VTEVREARPQNPPPSRAGSLTLIAGELALDFANSSSGRGSAAAQDHLRRPEHVAQWVARARVLPAADAQWLAEALRKQPALGERLLAEALALREDVYRLGADLAAGRLTSASRMDGLARVHARALSRGELTAVGDNFGWTWRVREAPVEAALGPITVSALNLLQRADLSRVKQCQGENCGWLFFDSTRNRSRRWCEMEVCGNRAKQRRFARAHSR
jgi:predicted RNA-binding Zn ribbon-like protein